MARISIPTTARLPSSLRLDQSEPTVSRILSRLSRPALLSLALDWLAEADQGLSGPYLVDEDDEDADDDNFYPAARSLDELREKYTDFQDRKGSKREVLDQILEGDWRHGLSLYQLAMADLSYLYEHPASQKWTAYRIVSLKTPSKDAEDGPAKVDRESLVVPRFHPSTFVQKLQAQVLPDVKAHYLLDRHKDLPLLLLRIFILESPYNTNLAALVTGERRQAANFDATRTIYIAFPDASPHIYISRSQAAGQANTGETRSLRSLIIEGIPKALSRPRERYTLKSTSLSTRNLRELLDKRGAGRTNTVGGGWSIYADQKKKESPLDTVLPTPPLSESDDVSSRRLDVKATKRAASAGAELEERARKRRRLVAQARFGDSAKIDDDKGVERVDIVLEDAYPTGQIRSGVQYEDQDLDEPAGGGGGSSTAQNARSKSGRRSTLDVAFEREATARGDGEGGEADDDDVEGAWRPNVRLTFHGSHVFAGIRQLVEGGVINGEHMPGWLTGEEGVTIGAVRHGRIRGHKGSGI